VCIIGLLTAKIAENAKFRKGDYSLRYFAFFAVKKDLTVRERIKQTKRRHEGHEEIKG
jgi:hypothetical protein